MSTDLFITFSFLSIPVLVGLGYVSVYILRPLLDPQHSQPWYMLLKDSVMIWYTLAKLKLGLTYHSSGTKGGVKSQGTNKSTIHWNKNIIRFPYEYNDQTYYHLETIPRGIIPFQSIQDEEGNDVSEAILPYLPLNLKTDRVAMKPRDFGYKTLTFMDHEDHLTVFQEDDKIELV